jgi:photosystem II stability/assembly factor-like uncharacterized protein
VRKTAVGDRQARSFSRMVRGPRFPRKLAILATAAGTSLLSLTAFTSVASAATVHPAPLAWSTQNASGSVKLNGQVPLGVANAGPMSAFKSLGVVAQKSSISLNFGLPVRNEKALNALIVEEAKTHLQLSRAQIYARFSPPQAQYTALESWLVKDGYTITHVGADRLEVTAKAPASVVDRSLDVKLDVFHVPAFTDEGINVPAQDFYSNTTAPVVPARLGLQSISGLNNVDQFFTDTQLAAAAESASGSTSASSASSVSPDTRTGGYFPRDLRSMYDVQGTYGYGTGQTMGFTLWGAAEVQAAATEFATVTGEPALTVDTACTASGNSPTSPSSCTTIQEQPNHLLNILENGNANNNYAGNDETGLDVETSHGMAPGVAEKYYLGDCSTTPSPGLTNADCNGSDVGLEDAIEDAANDPTLHSVSNSWGYGGDAEFGAQDPFVLATTNSFQIAAAAGTTFYFSTGDSGTYESGYPADNPYVVAVGGTSLFSTQSLTSGSSGAATLSTEDTWAAGGSWCSNIEPRPAWQTGAGVTANATCPGRAVPDISAIADTNTPVYEVYSTGASSYKTGSVGGTSVAGPVMNGLEADTENFVAGQTYSGATPAVGFEGPVMYMLGNSGNYTSYFRDVLCGNDADPSGGPDGEAAQPGWDEATGWGAVDWNNYSTGYAIELGATGLSVPPSLSQNYQWSCAKTPGNSTEHSISFPNSSVGFAVGTAASSPWPGLYLPSRAWGATNTFYTTSDGGTDWVPANSDMLSVACTSSTTCVEVGDGGVIKRTTNSGATWTADTTEFDQALTQVTCPSSSVCYAAGDRGTVLESSDGGVTWSYTPSVDGNPIYGLSCPSTSTCYAVDDYAHVMTTTNGGSSWTLSSTPVTTPGVNVPGSGGPNPYAGLFGVSCPGTTTCVAVGGFPPTAITGETAPPIVTTTDGTDWSLQSSGAPTGDNLMGVSCISGTTTCYAVGYAGTIVTTTNLTSWSTMTSNTTEPLTGITCLSTTSCVATGEAGTIDVLNGTTWTVTSTTLGSSAFLAGVTCVTANVCYTVGKQGVTLGFDSTNVSGTVTQQAGGGTTQTMESISCTSASTCETVGGAGTILGTTNGGQTWLPQTSGSTATLEGVSCSGSDCVAVGTTGAILGSTNGGATWTAQTSGVTVTLEGVSCNSGGCVVVGNAPTSGSGTILTSANGGGTWTPSSSGVPATLDGIACVSSTCYAVGTIPTGSTTAAILSSTNQGATWTQQVSNAPLALSSVACVDADDCFAGGAIGTVMATNNGRSTWYQEGNPISGPTTALNAGPTTITAVDGAACSQTACFMATGSSGNIMTTPLLSVSVNATGTYGSTPDLTDLPPSSSSISYSPSSEASSVTGALTCSTTATPSSDVGSYPVSNCSGLSLTGYNVIYNYSDSSYDVTTASTGTVSTPASSGVMLGTANSDGAVVTGNAGGGAPTGTVTFYECGSTGSATPCTSQANEVGTPVTLTAGAGDTSSASSVNFTPGSLGYYCFGAYYSGDSNYSASSDTSTDECFDVGMASSTTATTPTHSSIVLGNTNTDGAVVTGNAAGGSPTGTVSFYECGATATPEPCTSQANQLGSAVSLTSGAGDTSSANSVTFTPHAGGYYCFGAYYSGDSNYSATSDTGTNECFDVTSAASTTSSTPASNRIAIGSTNSDNVTVAGNSVGSAPLGTVDFYECGSVSGPAPCTSMADPVGSASLTAGAGDVSYASSASITFNSAGTYCFGVYYLGSSSASPPTTNYSASHDTATTECFVVGELPTITSFAPASGPVGTTITIKGTNLSSPLSVTIDGVAATIKSSTATRIKVTVAAGDHTGKIKVTTASGSVKSATPFTVT